MSLSDPSSRRRIARILPTSFRCSADATRQSIMLNRTHFRRKYIGKERPALTENRTSGRPTAGVRQ